jgi:hypothetical protein
MVYGFLFQDLICDPQWLLDRLGFGESLGFMRLQGVIHLLAARQCAAAALLEIELQQAEVSEEDRLAARYAELFTDATLFRHDEDDFCPSVNADLEAVTSFRARLLAPQLREYLRRRYARNWYQETRAGNLLKELWETGGSFSAEELAGELSMHSEDIQPWKENLLSCLSHD